jgi:hypothetical protein
MLQYFYNIIFIANVVLFVILLIVKFLSYAFLLTISILFLNKILNIF